MGHPEIGALMRMGKEAATTRGVGREGASSDCFRRFPSTSYKARPRRAVPVGGEMRQLQESVR